MAQVELVGVDELLAGIKRAEKFLTDDGIKPFNRLAAGELYRASLPGVPVYSGALKASGRFTGQKRAGVVRYGRKRIPWARPAHWGWPKRPQGGFNPAPEFLWGKIKPTRPKIVGVYLDAAIAALERARLR